MRNPLKRPVIDRISIVFRPADGQTLEQIASLTFVEWQANGRVWRFQRALPAVVTRHLKLIRKSCRDTQGVTDGGC